ncbi:unnamed protein product [Ambrosiozyma monospora]|uniref:Unnamed protein product n=1 Tax=Ambrosiozyma monospora TaxID=43982 RepID=A0ACB5T7W8_AMBMO|nr:unnamed protein product [Ambrosiozyma monospora]
MILGIVIFEAGSLICALANSMPLLIAGRVIQGVGGANIQTLSMMICSEVASVDFRPVIFAMIPVVFTIASVVGPIVGGVFATYVSWRWCFYINLCFGGVIVPIFIFSFNPKTPEGTFKEKIKQLDFFGSLLMISSIVLLLLALSFGVSEYSWNSGAVISCFVLSGVLCIGFLIWNFKFSRFPLARASIVINWRIQLAVGSLSTAFASFMVSVQFLSVYFQIVRNNDAIHTGLALLPIILTVSLFSICAGVTVKKTGHMKPLSILAGLLLCVGSGLLVLLKVQETSSRRIGLLIITGIGCGLALQPGFVSVSMLAPKEKNGLIMSTAYANFGRNIVCALVSQIAQVVYTETLKSNLANIAKNGKLQQSFSAADLVSLADNSGLLKKYVKSDQLIIKGAFMKSIHNVFYLCIAISAVSLICSVFMADIRVPIKKSKKASIDVEKK